MAAGAGRVVDVDGRHLAVSNLDKVMYPETGTTKGEVLGYYAEVAPLLLPHTAGRPCTRKRWVHGVGTETDPQPVFFEKQIDQGAPDWVRRGTIEHSDGPKTYPIVGDRPTLVWLAQLAALELHVPQWRFDARGERGNPDRLVLDLDPGPGVGLAECAIVAREARGILGGMGLDPVPVTSGSKGLHLYAALDGSFTSDQVRDVAHELAKALEADHRDLVVSRMAKDARPGKVFVDWSQNTAAKTTVAPYSLRGRFRPFAAAPRTWEELEDPDLRHLEFEEVLERVRAGLDPMARIDAWTGGLASFAATPREAAPASVPGSDAAVAAAAAAGTTGSGATGDALDRYRAKRDPAKTPEPIPARVEPSTLGGAPRFVVQEHHASRLHWDFRLERDGVLKSWAVPKGIPVVDAHPPIQHLAVEVEDHPLEYGSFAGTIPAGEYGGGEVTIWDDGTYDLEKWRDAEIIVTLHGRPGGPIGAGRYVLIRTSGSGEKAQWLLHRSAPKDGPNRRAPATTGAKRQDAAPPAPGIPYRPMLATAATIAEIGRGTHALEFKWDGIRALARSAGGGVRLVSRRGQDLALAYPELGRLPEALTADAVVDGEIVARDEGGAPSFELLQGRMNLTNPAEIAHARERTPIALLLFDVLEIDGVDVTGLPWVERRGRLESLVKPVDGVPVELPALAAGTPSAAIAEAARLGLEGIVAKDPSSPYRSGERTREWCKHAFRTTQEVVIGGWRPGQGSRAGRIASLLVGIPDGAGGIAYAGRVGSGFTERELDRMLTTLEPLGADASPFTAVPELDARDAHWVRPELVGEIELKGWTRTGAARQPSWRGLRPDKAPSDVAATPAPS
ncbi:ATP-dependent DNA ligase [Agromyces seonyuensis]|uniref:DNA ligase (ATP) n=1 Tax=Agromyces seonyuensis TaxID=2662446 RepID=A0A6I4P246_9MICO|nr:ATP-dependent DNA ligase [Agromyces seonyuensis]MWB98119.1 ATP-dependent DNA ligase [Agromyces seonyuensis]